MKNRSSENVPQAPAENARISLRLDEPISSRFERVVAKSKRTKTSIIEECLELALPKLEKQYEAAKAA